MTIKRPVVEKVRKAIEERSNKTGISQRAYYRYSALANSISDKAEDFMEEMKEKDGVVGRFRKWFNK